MTDMERLAVIEVSGTHFEVGVQLGRHARDILHNQIALSDGWRKVMEFRHDTRVMAISGLVEERFPTYCDEIRGMAEGAEMPFDDMMLWHFRGDIWDMPPEGCTTVQIPGKEPIVAHNEDGPSALLHRCAIAQVRPTGSKAFTSFIYPGTIPGHAFAVNEKGLVATINHIGALVSGVGLPRTLLGRALLDCDTLDEAVNLLQKSPRSGAYHVTLAQAGDNRIFGVEFTHSNCSVRNIDRPQCHSNHLIHPDTAHERQDITKSSRSRLRRSTELVEGNTEVDPLAVLWDRSDPEQPVHTTETLATAVFNIGPNAVDWAVYDLIGEAPCFTEQAAYSG